MRSMVVAIVSGVMLVWFSGAALGRLPQPTAEEAAKRKVAAEKKSKDDEAAKKALERAQDRVAARYKARQRR